jgi:hypothetical protein
MGGAFGGLIGRGRTMLAHDFYRRKIEDQERHVPEFHDAAHARELGRVDLA